MINADYHKMNDRIERLWFDAVPLPPDPDVVAFAERDFRAVGSTISVDFRVEFTPWLRFPLNLVADPAIRVITIIGPAQFGKSVFGEIVICYGIANGSTDIQYNWEDDQKGKSRYKNRVERILKACPPVADLWPTGINRHNAKTCEVHFPHLNFSMQGVHTSANLESDTIGLQINEEVHAWKPGRLNLAEQRQKQVWNYRRVNLSTGGVKGDQLFIEANSGSCRYWQEPCDGCGQYFTPRIRVREGKLGGWHYDKTRAIRKDGSVDYEALAATLYQECPHCGHRMYDDPGERRRRSEQGGYSDPTNPSAASGRETLFIHGASLYNRKMVEIIHERDNALKAASYGDLEPFKIYTQRVECEDGGFWDPEDRPLAGKITVIPTLTKSKDGIPDHDYRLMTIDRQRGEARKGEGVHYWFVIRDWKRVDDGRMKTRLVQEGRVFDETKLDDLAKKYNVTKDGKGCPLAFVDSGDEATKVYELAHRYGFWAIKGEGRSGWNHEIKDKRTGKVIKRIKRIFSPLQYIDPFVGKRGAGRVTVPLLAYSKQGIRDLLDLIRTSDRYDWEIPEDVSEDFKRHFEAEELTEGTHPKTGETFFFWKQTSKRNDLFVCEAYQALWAALLKLAGSEPSEERPEDIEIE